jgi:hypothetical protein
VQQIVQAKAHWMGFAEASGVWMEDVAFGMWFESLQMSCRIIDKTFTQHCGGENTITVVDGLVRRADRYSTCKVPAWIERDTQAIDMLGSVVCGTTAEAANADGPSGISSNGAFGQQLRGTEKAKLQVIEKAKLQVIEKAKSLRMSLGMAIEKAKLQVIEKGKSGGFDVPSSRTRRFRTRFQARGRHNDND